MFITFNTFCNLDLNIQLKIVLFKFIAKEKQL